MDSKLAFLLLILSASTLCHIRIGRVMHNDGKGFLHQKKQIGNVLNGIVKEVILCLSKQDGQGKNIRICPFLSRSNQKGERQRLPLRSSSY